MTDKHNTPQIMLRLTVDKTAQHTTTCVNTDGRHINATHNLCEH